MSERRLARLLSIAKKEHARDGVLYTDTLMLLSELGVDLNALVKRLDAQRAS